MAASAISAAALALPLPPEGCWRCMDAPADSPRAMPDSDPAALATSNGRVGCVGLLLCERDRPVLRRVLQHLDDSLADLLQAHAPAAAAAPAAPAGTGLAPSSTAAASSLAAPSPPALLGVDLLVSLRAQDLFCWRVLQRHRPRNVRRLLLYVCPPYHNNDFVNLNGLFHTDAVLDAICLQRNAVRQFAHAQHYRFLFFLDSDILLQRSTLRLCYEARRACVGSVYVTRWAQHCVVAVAHQPQSQLQPQCGDGTDSEFDGSASGTNPGDTDALVSDNGDETPEISSAEAVRLASQECAVQLLLDPQFLQAPAHSPSPPPLSHPCVLLGFGALMVHRRLLHVPYRLAESIGGVCGEDVGFCIALLRLHQQGLDRLARRGRSRSNKRSDSDSDSDSDFPGTESDCSRGSGGGEERWLDADLRPHFLANHSVEHLAGGRGLTVRPPPAPAPAQADLAGPGYCPSQACTTFVPLVSRAAVGKAVDAVCALSAAAQERERTQEHGAGAGAGVAAADLDPATVPFPPCAMLTRIRSSQIFCLEQHVLVPWRCVATPCPRPRPTAPPPPPRSTRPSHDGRDGIDGSPLQRSSLERLERSWMGPQFYAHLSRTELDGSDSGSNALPPPVLLQPVWHFPASATRPLVSIDAALATASASATASAAAQGRNGDCI